MNTEHGIPEDLLGDRVSGIIREKLRLQGIDFLCLMFTFYGEKELFYTLQDIYNSGETMPYFNVGLNRRS